MNSQETPQATTVTPKLSDVFKLWETLLPKRENSIPIRVLYIVLITITTLVAGFALLLLIFIAGIFKAALEESTESEKSTKSSPPHGDDPWRNFSMSLNGHD